MAVANSQTEASEKTGTARRPQTRFWFAALMFLIVGLPAVWNLSSWPARLRYPGEQTGIEGMRLAEMVHLRQHVLVYSPASPQRFDAVIYGPLYYLLGAELIDPAKPAYFPLRVLSLVATLGCAAAAALLAFWLSRSCFAAALASLLLLSNGFVSLFGLTVRPDMMALLLVFSGFLVAYRFQTGRRLLWAIPLMLAGLFYKQQFVAAPAAVFLFLVLERRYRLAAQFAGFLALGGLGLLALFQYVAFAGQDFFLHLITYNLVPFEWHRLLLGAILLFVILTVPLLVGFEFLRRQPSRLIACYLGCLIPLTLLGMGKQGSDTNYFVEVILVVSCLFAAFAAESVALPSRAVELLLLTVVSVFLGAIYRAPIPDEEDFRRDQAIQDHLRKNFSPGTKSLGYFSGDLLRAGLDVPISDFFQYSWLVCSGEIPAQDLIGQLKDRRFGVLLVGADLNDEQEAHRPRAICMTEMQHRTILDNYELAETLDLPGPEQTDQSARMHVWVPRPVVQGSNPLSPGD